MKKINTKRLVAMAMCVAAAIVLSRFLSINAWNLKIGFTFVPIFLMAYLYGPVAAAIVAGMADFMGAILFPIGPYFPGFTFTAAMSGVVLGLLLHQKQSPLRIILAVVINELILGFLLNSFWISILYGTPFSGLLAIRLMQCAVMVPVEFFVISGIKGALCHGAKAIIR